MAKKCRIHIALKGRDHSRCVTLPLFDMAGMAGSMKAEFYSRYSKRGMIGIDCKRCGQTGVFYTGFIWRDG